MEIDVHTYVFLLMLNNNCDWAQIIVIKLSMDDWSLTICPTLFYLKRKTRKIKCFPAHIIILNLKETKWVVKSNSTIIH